MYHGVRITPDLIVLIFGLLAWIVGGIAKAARRVSRRGNSAPPMTPPPAPGPSAYQSPRLPQPAAAPAPLRPAASFQPVLNQPVPNQAAPRRRQPAAGGPAVTSEATLSELEQQERALFFSEPAALNAPLTSAAPPAAAPVRRLLGSPDDLVRAIILQEVLGPPLSRRSAPKPPLSPSSSRPIAPPQ